MVFSFSKFLFLLVNEFDHCLSGPYMSLCGGKLLLLKDEEVVELIDVAVAARGV